MDSTQHLTPRHLQILKLQALAEPVKAIAAQLGISHKTVEKHSTAIYKKLGLHDRVHLAHYALASGLVNNLYAFPLKPAPATPQAGQ